MRHSGLIHDLLGQGTFNTNVNHLLDVGLLLLIVLVLWSCIRQMRSKTIDLPLAEFVFLLTLAAQPLIGFFMARLATHAMEPRYVLGSAIGIAALLAIALTPLLRNSGTARVMLLLLFCVFIAKGFAGIRTEQQITQGERSYLTLSPAVKSSIMASPSQLLYTQDIDLFGLFIYHEPDPEVRSHLALVYSGDEEMRWNHIDSDSRIVLHLKEFTNYTIVPYEGLAAQPGPHIFVVDEGGWNWIAQALAHEHAGLRFIGKIGGNDVVSVSFPALP